MLRLICGVQSALTVFNTKFLNKHDQLENETRIKPERQGEENVSLFESAFAKRGKIRKGIRRTYSRHRKHGAYAYTFIVIL